jgi:hypothetical protein
MGLLEHLQWQAGVRSETVPAIVHLVRNSSFHTIFKGDRESRECQLIHQGSICPVNGGSPSQTAETAHPPVHFGRTGAQFQPPETTRRDGNGSAAVDGHHDNLGSLRCGWGAVSPGEWISALACPPIQTDAQRDRQVVAGEGDVCPRRAEPVFATPITGCLDTPLSERVRV